jgi:hypothetical protein
MAETLAPLSCNGIFSSVEAEVVEGGAVSHARYHGVLWLGRYVNKL